MKYCKYCVAPIEDGANECPACHKRLDAEAPLHQLAPGTILNGRYYVGAALGEGGFGITYIGRDLNLDMKVAIKEYFPTGDVNRSNTVSASLTCGTQGERKEYFEQGRERFLKEARTLAKFSGTEGIVDVRDFFDANNTAYIVMEYLDGLTLKDMLKQNGVMSAGHVVNLLMPIMRALKQVHDQDLIHRDISPDNIMFVDGRIKLLDFGAARNVSAVANKSLSVVLKPGYAPEEQYRTKGSQGPWTDIYALCATMYKCITGSAPEDSTERLVNDTLRRPSEMGIAIDPQIENTIMKGLAVNAKDRFRNITELIAAFEGRIPVTAPVNTEKTIPVYNNVQAPAQAPAQAPVQAPVQAPAQTPVQTPVNAPVQAPYQPPVPVNAPAKKSKTGLIIGIVVGVVILILGIVLVALIGGSGGSETPAGNNNYVDSDSYDDNDETTTNNSSDGVVDNETTTQGSGFIDTPAADVQMSDNLYDATFKLDGKVYQLPLTYAELSADGWAYSDEKIYVEAGTREWHTMTKGDMSIDVIVENDEVFGTEIINCPIMAISVSPAYNVDFEVAKGISLYSSVEEIRAAFGVEDYLFEDDALTSLDYESDDGSVLVNFWMYDITDDMWDYSEIQISYYNYY